MLFEEKDVETRLGEMSGGEKTGGSAADDGDVDHATIIGVFASRPTLWWPSSPSELLSATLPATAERDPERQGDEADVEPEAPAPDVERVIAELAAPGHVTIGIDLGDAGQSRSHT